jgi:Domain of unknown function (DUF3786)
MMNEQIWSKLEEERPEMLCRRTGARLERGLVLLTVLDRTLALDPVQRCAQWLATATGCPANPPSEAAEVVATAYLLLARELPLAGRWISPLDLPLGEMFFRGPHGLPTGGLEAAFGDSAARFHAAAATLAGKPLTFADVACEFEVLPRVPVAVLLWLADDEFDARARFLVDETVGEHLALDSLLGVLAMLADRLITAPCG